MNYNGDIEVEVQPNGKGHLTIKVPHAWVAGAILVLLQVAGAGSGALYATYSTQTTVTSGVQGVERILDLLSDGNEQMSERIKAIHGYIQLSAQGAEDLRTQVKENTRILAEINTRTIHIEKRLKINEIPDRRVGGGAR